MSDSLYCVKPLFNHFRSVQFIPDKSQTRDFIHLTEGREGERNILREGGKERLDWGDNFALVLFLILLFLINEPCFFQPFKYLCDWIVTDGMTVKECKELLQPEICQRCGIDVPVEKYVLLSNLRYKISEIMELCTKILYFLDNLLGTK